jgi:hypothetical protein
MVKRKAHVQVYGNGGKDVCKNNRSKYRKSVYYKETAAAIR